MFIDYFLPSPGPERRKALAATYENYSYGGFSYDGMSPTTDEESVIRMQEMIGAQIYSSEVLFRRYLEAKKPESYIHTDMRIANLTAILFLNTPRQCRGGTAFWRHKEHGFDRPPSIEEMKKRGLPNTREFWRGILQEGEDESKWHMVEYVPMQFNRLLIFESGKFHSRYPKEPFGSSLDSARLIKLFFLITDQYFKSPEG